MWHVLHATTFNRTKRNDNADMQIRDNTQGMTRVVAEEARYKTDQDVCLLHKYVGLSTAIIITFLQNV